MNGAPERFKPKVFRQLVYINEPYIKVADNNIMIDRNMANFEIVNYKIVNNIYQSKSNVIRELMQNGLNITNDDDYTAPDKIKLLSQAKIGFKDLFDLYCEIADPIPRGLFSSVYEELPDYRLELIEKKNPLVSDAYFILGKDEVKRMKYHQSNIRREIILKKNKNADRMMTEWLDYDFTSHKAMTVKEVKEKLQKLYALVGKQQTAKATDIKKWYEIKEHVKTIDGKSVACITIIRPKFVRLKNTENDLPF